VFLSRFKPEVVIKGLHEKVRRGGVESAGERSRRRGQRVDRQALAMDKLT